MEVDEASNGIEAIEKVKFGEDIKSYKTGSSNNVTKRIELFTLGVHQLID